MSKLSAVYDLMVTRLGVLFPEAQRIPYPNIIELNTEVILRNGWGVAVGSGNNTERFVDGQISTERTFTVVLAREMISLEGDPLAYAQKEMDLLEAAVAVVRDFQSNEGLNGAVVLSAAHRTTWQSDNGVNLVTAVEGDGIFLSTEIVFKTEYFEQLEE